MTTHDALGAHPHLPRHAKPYVITGLRARWRVVNLALPERIRRTTFGLAGVVLAAMLAVAAFGTAVRVLGFGLLALSIGLAVSGVIGHSPLRAAATHARARRR